MSRGIFITFEGIDGSGKTTQVKKLREHLESRGRDVSVVREPGGTPTGEQIRNMLLDGVELAPWTEASLFAAARAELVARVIRPALDEGRDVICDRYIDSSLAYQAIGRDLRLDAVLGWNTNVVDGLMPDRTYLLLLPAEDATRRRGTQLRLFGSDGLEGPPDRLERESYAFRRRVDEAYQSLSIMFNDRVLAIPANKRRSDIARLIRADANKLLRKQEAVAA